MNDQSGRSARLRNFAAGALAALAVVGAIAGTAALARQSHAKTHHAAIASGRVTKKLTSPVPDKAHAPQPTVNQQPFFSAIEQLVDNGTITAAEGQAVDREIRAGRIDTDTLASSGLSRTQLQAVNQALGNIKRALARNAQ